MTQSIRPVKNRHMSVAEGPRFKNIATKEIHLLFFVSFMFTYQYTGKALYHCTQRIASKCTEFVKGILVLRITKFNIKTIVFH